MILLMGTIAATAKISQTFSGWWSIFLFSLVYSLINFKDKEMLFYVYLGLSGILALAVCFEAFMTAVGMTEPIDRVIM